MFALLIPLVLSLAPQLAGLIFGSKGADATAKVAAVVLGAGLTDYGNCRCHVTDAGGRTAQAREYLAACREYHDQDPGIRSGVLV